MYRITNKTNIHLAVPCGMLEIGEGTVIDEDVWLCHSFKDDAGAKLKIGRHCVIRSGSVIYNGVVIGDHCNFGQHAVVREGCKIGNHTSIGTGVKVECHTRIGNHTSIETQSHITAFADIGNYVFFGAMVITNNDFKMNYKRAGHGTDLKGPTVEDNVRIGSGAMLMAGVTIGKNSIVNAGEIVRKNVPSDTLMFTQKGKVLYKKIKPEAIVE